MVGTHKGWWGGRKVNTVPRRPVVAKRTISKEGSLLHILLMWRYIAVQIPILNDGQKCYRSVSQWCYNKKNLNKYNEKRRPVSGFRHVHMRYFTIIFHHIRLSLWSLFQPKKVTVLPHPPHSPDLAPVTVSFFFLFPKLEKFLFGRRYPWLSDQSVHQRSTYLSVRRRISNMDSEIETMKSILYLSRKRRDRGGILTENWLKICQKLY